MIDNESLLSLLVDIKWWYPIGLAIIILGAGLFYIYTTITKIKYWSKT